jgi:hypothetical protein
VLHVGRPVHLFVLKRAACWPPRPPVCFETCGMLAAPSTCYYSMCSMLAAPSTYLYMTCGMLTAPSSLSLRGAPAPPSSPSSLFQPNDMYPAPPALACGMYPDLSIFPSTERHIHHPVHLSTCSLLTATSSLFVGSTSPSISFSVVYLVVGSISPSIFLFVDVWHDRHLVSLFACGILTAPSVDARLDHRPICMLTCDMLIAPSTC